MGGWAYMQCMTTASSSRFDCWYFSTASYEDEEYQSRTNLLTQQETLLMDGHRLTPCFLSHSSLSCSTRET